MKSLALFPTLAIRANAGDAAPLVFPEYSTQIFRVSPNDPSATIETLSEDFTSSDVITADNRINVTLSNSWTYDALSTYTSGWGTRVQFTTTGTLPSSLNTSDYYYLSPNGSGGYDVYPEYNETNKASLVDGLDNQFISETAFPAQCYAQRQNKITFSDGGSGTHTIVSRPLVKDLPNMITGGPDVSIGTTSTNLHNRFELLTDGSRKAILAETRHRDHEWCGSYDRHGFGMDMTGLEVQDFNDALRSQRQLALTVVIDQRELDHYNIYKTPIEASDVNTTTGVLDYTGSSSDHQMVTGRKVQLRVNAGGTLPTGFSAGDVTDQGVETGTTYYVRDLNNDDITLHPTKNDADNNTNVVIPSDQGTGGFSVVAIQSAGDRERMRFLAEIREPPSGSDNTIVPRTNNVTYVNANEFNFASDFTVSGSNNGRVGSSGRQMDDLPNANHLAAITGDSADNGIGVVYMQYNLGARPVIREDTGRFLEQGYYYTTDDPNSSVYVRLHETVADARAAVGVSTSALTDEHITFSAAGEGFCKFQQVVLLPFSIDTEQSEEAIMWSPYNNQKAVYTFLVDYNDSSASGIKYYIYKNGTLEKEQDTSLAKGLTSSGTTTNSMFTFLNSPQNHVPFEGHVYDMLLDATTTTIPTAQIQAVHNYYQSYYSIANNPVTNILPPEISGVGYTGQTLTAKQGFWLNATTITGQWYADGVAISGETGTTYTVSSANDGAAFTYVETSGAVTATSNEIHNFTFADLTTEVWYDMSDTDDITTIVNAVTRIEDKSGNDNFADQTNASFRPATNGATINGLNCVEFNLDFLNFDTKATGIKAVFAVIDNASGSAGSANVTTIVGETDLASNSCDYIFVRNGLSDYTISIDGNIPRTGNAAFNGGTAVSGTDIDLGVSIAQKSDVNQVRVDYPSSSASFDQLARFDNGGSNFAATINIGEIALLTTIPDDVTIRKIEGLLYHKWGTSIASGHPYEFFAPTV